MRVLHLIETLDAGGAERALVNMIPWLSRQGIESEVATLWGEDTLAWELEEQGIPVHRMKLAQRWNLLQGAKVVANLAEHREIDLIHSHLYFAGLYASLACRGRKMFTAVTFHNLAYAPGCNKPGLSWWLRKLLHRFLLARTVDLSIGVSEAVAQHYQQHLGLRDVLVIPNAVDPEILRRKLSLDVANIRQAFDVPQKATVILLVGRLVHEKGHLWMLEAMSRVESNGDEVLLLIIGEGPLRSQLEQRIVELGLQKNARLMGSVDHEDVLQLMQAADILVAPSLYEGFGLGVAEAMCMELPVVASRVGGLVELLGDGCGYLVEPNDKKAMSEVLNETIASPQGSAQVVTKARQRIKTDFSLQVVSRRLSDLYTGLMD